MVIGVVGIFTATCQSIVTIMVIYSNHAPPCVHCFSLILLGKKVQMYGFIILLQVYLLLHNVMLCASQPLVSTRKRYALNSHVCLKTRLYDITCVDPIIEKYHKLLILIEVSISYCIPIDIVTFLQTSCNTGILRSELIIIHCFSNSISVSHFMLQNLSSR